MSHDELRPTDMVVTTLRDMFLAASDEDATKALENGNGSLVVEIAHLIDATAATSFCKGLRRAIEQAEAQAAPQPLVDRLKDMLRTAEAIDARKGYPGRVSMIDPEGKILLFQVDGTPDEVRPLAQHLREALDPGGVVVVLPVGSTLDALDDAALRKAGFTKLPTAEEITAAHQSLAEGEEWDDTDLAVVTAKTVLRLAGDPPPNAFKDGVYQHPRIPGGWPDKVVEGDELMPKGEGS